MGEGVPDLAYEAAAPYRNRESFTHRSFSRRGNGLAAAAFGAGELPKSAEARIQRPSR
jgi:hypothetical protein